MYILDVIPIQKGFPLEMLSYFSAREVALGTCVTIPVQKRSIPGLVVGRRDVRDMKSSLKNQSFALRNIGDILPYTFPEPIIRAIITTAKYYAAPIQDVLAFVFPDQYYGEKNLPNIPPATLRPERLAIQTETIERMTWYRTYGRQALAEKKSLHIICPTIESCERLTAALSRGIERYVLTLHSGVSKVKQKARIKTYLESPDPLILISTPSFLGLMRDDTGTYLIEEESSEHYRLSFRPLIDTRFLVESFALARGASLIRGDTLLSLETHARLRDGTYSRTLPVRFHTEHTCQVIHQEEVIWNGDGLASWFLESLKTSITNKKKMLVLVPRRGFATLTSCRDCGHVVSCPTCASPLVLHDKKRGSTTAVRRYICHTCRHDVEVTNTCSSCGGWRLTLSGTTLGKIGSLLESAIDIQDVSLLDEDTLRSKKVRTQIKHWHETSGSVLVATPSVVPYLANFQPDETHLLGFDAFFSFPAYTMNERVLRLGLALREGTREKLVLYSKKSESRVRDALLDTSFQKAIMDELAERETFQLPPSFVIIKTHLDMRPDYVQHILDVLERSLADVHPDLFRSKRKGITLRGEPLTVVCSLPRDVWESWITLESHPLMFPEVRELLYSVTYEINPETLFT